LLKHFQLNRRTPFTPLVVPLPLPPPRAFNAVSGAVARTPARHSVGGAAIAAADDAATGCAAAQGLTLVL
jgi:hypothetical protein